MTESVQNWNPEHRRRTAAPGSRYPPFPLGDDVAAARLALTRESDDLAFDVPSHQDQPGELVDCPCGMAAWFVSGPAPVFPADCCACGDPYPGRSAA